jgi:hypothetical protein
MVTGLMKMNKALSKSRIADLLLIVAFCGLVMGVYQWFVRLPRHQSVFLPVLGFMVAFMVWRALWRRVRVMRTAPTCFECGRRYLPARQPEKVVLCPECRQRSVDPITAGKARARGLLSLLVLLLLFGVGVGFIVQTPYPGIYSSSRFWVTLLLVTIVAAAALFVVVVGIAVVLALVRSVLWRSER